MTSTPIPANAAPTDLLAALFAMPAAAPAVQGFGALIQQALGAIAVPDLPNPPDPPNPPDVEPVEMPEADAEMVAQLAPPVLPVTVPVPVTKDVDDPSPVTQRPAGPDAHGPGVGVDGTGPRGAGNEWSGRLPAPGPGAGGPEGRGSIPREASPAPQAAGGPEGRGIPLPSPSTPAAMPVITTPTSTMTENAAAPAPALTPVTDQVFEQVTSLTSRGEGTHRITLQLNPDDLGEVRVVMTIRDGAVHVRLAASERDARAALTEGSPELHRLLEATGATDAKVTVRELGRGFEHGLMRETNGGHDFNGWSLGRGSQGGNPNLDQSSREHAGTRADQPATDGTDQPSPRRAVADETVTSRRSTGVDVSM